MIGCVASSRVMFEPETLIQKARIEADGGVVIDIEHMNSFIRTLKEMDVYSNARLLTNSKFGIKKDVNNKISKIYDVSGNNNDFVQTSTALMPLYNDAIYFNGLGSRLYAMHNSSLNLNTLTCFIQLRAMPQTAWRVIIGKINDNLRLRYSIEAAGTTSSLSARLDTVDVFNRTLPASNVLDNSKKSIGFVIGASTSRLVVDGVTVHTANFNNNGIANGNNIDLTTGSFLGYIYSVIILDNQLTNNQLLSFHNA